MCSIDYMALDEGSQEPSNCLLTAQNDDSHDLRDSGISISEHAHMNNFNNSSYEEFDLRAHQQEMNIVQSPPKEFTKSNPPPIPPKCSYIGSSSSSGGLDADIKKDNFGNIVSPENYSIPKIQTETKTSKLDNS